MVWLRGGADDPVHGHRRIDESATLIGADDGHVTGLQHADLHEQRGLIPVDVLVGHFVARSP
jgi:hypothetical protein